MEGKVFYFIYCVTGILFFDLFFLFLWGNSGCVINSRRVDQLSIDGNSWVFICWFLVVFNCRTANDIGNAGRGRERNRGKRWRF